MPIIPQPLDAINDPSPEELKKEELEKEEWEEDDLEADAAGEIVYRPDGFHWIAPDGRQEFGPFASRSDAMADRDEASDGIPAPGESLEEAEDELGQASWIDPDTGELAEGQSRPRLDD